jgi:hypothetical protein
VANVWFECHREHDSSRLGQNTLEYEADDNGTSDVTSMLESLAFIDTFIHASNQKSMLQHRTKASGSCNRCDGDSFAAFLAEIDFQ